MNANFEPLDVTEPNSWEFQKKFLPADLFSETEFRRLGIPDAEVYYLRNLSRPHPGSLLLDKIIPEVPWRTEKVSVWSKTYTQPRLVAWFGDGGTNYFYSGVGLESPAWTPVLLDIKERIEQAADSIFNSVLLNYYRNHRESMRFHSDHEPELGGGAG